MGSCPKMQNKFVNYDECLNLIDDLHTKLSSADDDESGQAEAERLFEAFKKLIDKYQEIPELLDPYLTGIIEKLTSGLDDANISRIKFHTTFKFLYQLIKVYGYKSIGKRFPHEADKLPLLIRLLEKEQPGDKINWHTRYALTVWLSIVVLTPFDLNKFESSSTGVNLAQEIYAILQRGLGFSDSCQYATAFCLSQLFSRPDVLKGRTLVNEFIATTVEKLTSYDPSLALTVDDIQIIGSLKTVSYMLKYLPRVDMKPHAYAIIDCVLKLDMDKFMNKECAKHLIVKLTQRAGLALLPKTLSTWRHKRSAKILGQLANHREAGIDVDDSIPASQHIADVKLPANNEDEVNSGECIEAVITILFLAAHDKFTKIRWSAGKGIARIASRLSRERANEIVDLVITSLFDPKNSTEFAWHAGCMALAEMSRHGLIVEEKLAEITRVIGNAIIYDKIKGSFPVGTHIREASCYMFWAMVRTYDVDLVRPHVSSISTKLMCTMLFDREVQCRRAASAAFQELIGRQGAFNEDIIKIMTDVDYQNVGNRQLTYTQLALQVASFGDHYPRSFVEHLLEKKIGHWDVQIRRLAGDSLSSLMLHLDHDFVRSQVLPQLVKMSDQDADLNVKHGALLALAKVIRGLVPLLFTFDQELIDFVGGRVSKCERQLKIKQQAPNFVEALCTMITSAEAAHFCYGKEILTKWETLALSALDSDNESLRDIGSNALISLYKTYYKDNKTCQDRLLTILNKSLTSLNESTRCGALLALSKLGLPGQAFEGNNAEIFSNAPADTDGAYGAGGVSLHLKGGGIKIDSDTPDIVLMSLTSYIAKETCEKANDIVFALAKAEACKAFVNFVRSLDRFRLIVSASYLTAGYEALLGKTEDYTLDKRGDIGVVVRRASIKALEELTLYLLSIQVHLLFEPARVTNVVARTLQQAVSYNNSAREVAATAFYKLIASDLPADTIPHKAEILVLFDKFEVNDEFNWRDDSTPIFVRLLAYPEYNIDLWTGLLPSVGQVSELCARQFREALSDYIVSLAGDKRQSERELVFDAFLRTLGRKDKADRLLTTGLSVADYLLTQGLLSETSPDFQERLASFCWESKGTDDPKRIMSVARVMCSMLQFGGQIQRDCLEHSLSFLVNSYAKVRVYTAEQLYQSIMTYQTDLDESMCTAMDLLSQTEWAEPLEKVKAVRDEICALLL